MTALTANERRVIVERGRGWENARASTLAAIFATGRQNIVAILKDKCATCGEFICDHTEAEWAGHHARPSGQFPPSHSAALSPKEVA